VASHISGSQQRSAPETSESNGQVIEEQALSRAPASARLMGQAFGGSGLSWLLDMGTAMSAVRRALAIRKTDRVETGEN